MYQRNGLLVGYGTGMQAQRAAGKLIEGQSERKPHKLASKLASRRGSAHGSAQCSQSGTALPGYSSACMVCQLLASHHQQPLRYCMEKRLGGRPPPPAAMRRSF